jgi:tetratricopeptide (TPR) repeat protein
LQVGKWASMQVNAAHLPNPRRALVFVGLALLAISLTLILGTTRTPYADLIRRGDALAEQAHRTAAIAAYREAARLRPTDPLPYIQRARVYLDWGRAGAALDALDEAELLGGDDLLLARLRLRAQVAREDWPAAIEEARRQLPGDGEAQLAMANAYVQMRDWDAARREYETLLLQAEPNGPVAQIAHERLGALLAGQDPAALDHLSAARTDLSRQLLDVLLAKGVTDDPAYTDALLGRTLLASGEWALATRCLERAVEIAPHYADAHAHLGHALDRMARVSNARAQQARAKQARAHLTRAVALAPDSVPARTFLGLHYDQRGDYAAARAEYEAAYDLDPGSAALCVEIGQTWAAEGRYNVAEIWLREAADLRPEDPTYWEILTRFYLAHQLNLEDRAIDAAEMLLALAPESAAAHELRGWAALQAGDYEAAAGFLQQALTLDPHLASAYYRLGLLHQARGAGEGAVGAAAQEAFIRALDLDTSGALRPHIERALDELDRR